MQEKYKTLLIRLVNFDSPQSLQELMTSLRAYDSDRRERLVHLSKSQIASILERYLSGDLKDIDVEAWADALEIREDIEFGDDNDLISTQIIWELANPMLTQPLTAEIAKSFILRLRGE